MLELVRVDLVVLPTQMLPEVKAHCRVEFTRDDEYLTNATARAIAEVETLTNLSINPSTWKWDTTDERWENAQTGHVPKMPVRSVYQIDAVGGKQIVKLDYFGFEAALPSDNRRGVFYIEAGYEKAADVTPAVINPILMRAATLYEYRESLQTGSYSELPDMSERVLSGLWRPSV
jgi:uncharacterized phiE125 gp8 family phage protein